ncbi:MAG: alpha-amylase family glycosyl hydrolase [Gaiellaceae bacterium]
MDQPWWQKAVLYQVYVRSFADSNGDGVGDLRGAIDKLDYLAWLGVDALWLSPVTVSPDKDWGYDVSDYRDVQPVFGTMDDLDELIAGAHERDMRIVLDLVPNHTSDRHPWFQDARSSRDARHRDWYVWADPLPDGSPPNNWRASFDKRSAWELTPETGQMYLHSFLREQVDLDWWNGEVRDAMDDVMRFWLDRGISGFRLDVAHAIVKDRDLRDIPDDYDKDVLVDIDETFAVLRRWRALVDAYERQRLLLGETWVMDLERLAQFYGNGTDQLHLAFNFPYTFAPLEASALRDVVERSHAAFPRDAWPVWMLSNHDIPRFSTRTCGGDERKIRCALLALLTQRGTAVLYQGDEIGLEQADVPPDRIRDIDDRDGCRTPMPWTSDGGWSDPWLPLGDTTRNVEDERADPNSTLNFVRELIALRRSNADFQSGSYESLDAPDGVWAYRRGGSTVALNLSDEPRAYGRTTLAPWTGAIS